MGNALRKLIINGTELTPRQASELPRAASYAAITKRMRMRNDLSDNDIVYMPMATKSQAGKRGSRNSPFNSGNKRL